MTLARPSLLPVNEPLHVAGIGASAGGLEAMLQMFARLRPTGRIAYVVAQHMADNGHTELVVRLIQRESALPVELGVSGARLKPDTVLVIPAGKDGRVFGETLRLSEPAPEHLSTPSVNALFASIAETCRSFGLGIILSGAGSDGAAGCRMIREAGGLTLAQDPAEAKFDGMPDAAIRARQIDEIMPVAMMGPSLAARFPAIAASVTPAVAPPAAPLPSPADPGPVDEELRDLQTLVRKVFEATGIDFSCYKEETLLRRLEKRRSVLGIGTMEAYRALVQRDPGELQVLQHLFLVSVSSFFRDRESFRVLERALAAAIAEKPEGEPIRVWVPGCASGEEPYSLAIILNRLIEERGGKHPIAITATDLNPDALAMAREGLYRKTAFKEAEDGLRERYFLQRGQHYEIRPEIKSCVTFERRDVLSGAPPADLDLVSCRNLLIYMKSQLQDDLIKVFHQSLRPHGLLFIGQSESLGLAGNALFAPIDHYHRLFRRRCSGAGR
ncbi:Chemotaxis protein methyltransferase CheR [Paramagnetospirillum magnetotacticum MS-1]|uniref:protein-glutamate O-methyltransferase n=1 Tax=Paramagnetospirillum magnetotacticum MS-1 TaxID=272627 RepID=A0A0C2YW49_PARME|nr:CheR family methyltransferase [Paramagnetospirillum magnetotacticum]KIL99343.1 Chemotaxis protein methyltransferase CheR [Paramagnetospirillum magnetotacticum MS-1]